MWKKFLMNQAVFSRNFADFDDAWTAEAISMYTDASSTIGAGGYCGKHWFALTWESSFLEKQKPSINYLELYAVVIAVFNWIHLFKDRKIALFCDNMSVVNMINNTSSSCKNCMILIRIMVLKGMIHNVKITARHVPGVLNEISDSLSRNQPERFRALTNSSPFDRYPTAIPEELWPVEKIWIN